MFFALQAATLLIANATALARDTPAPDLSQVILRGNDEGTVALQALVHQQRLTAVVFYSSTCPCFAVHRARLTELVREMSPRGVRVLIVDSERHPKGEVLPGHVALTSLPVLRDENGLLARRLDAQFATETFVFDATGALRYRGGIDDERKYLSGKPRTYLRDVLSSLLAGTAPRYTTTKALGCALRLL